MKMNEFAQQKWEEQYCDKYLPEELKDGNSEKQFSLPIEVSFIPAYELEQLINSDKAPF